MDLIIPAAWAQQAGAAGGSAWLQLLPLVLLSPFLWAAVALVAAAAAVAWRDCRTASAELPIISARRRVLELSTLLLMPALLLACGEYFSLPRPLSRTRTKS